MSKARFIVETWNSEWPYAEFEELKFLQLPNKTLNEILQRYDLYLFDRMICPKCESDLKYPDEMVEAPHCHSCKWIKE